MTYSAISLQIAPGVVKEIDALAKEEHIERSNLLRELLNIGLRETKIERAVDQYKTGQEYNRQDARDDGLIKA
jgi:metal-responsive CopG/Arc/MetJ family transcriptional regulator